MKALPSLNRKQIAIAGAVGLPFLGFLVYLSAASLANPASEPLNYIAKPTLNTFNLGGGTAVAYTPWFENGTWQGDLIAYPVNNLGALGTTATWKAKTVYADPAGANANSVSSTWWNSARVVVTTNGGGGTWTGNKPDANAKIPFRYNNYTTTPSPTAGTVLESGQQVSITPTAADQQKIINFVRGERANEKISAAQVAAATTTNPSPPANAAGTLRERWSILGDIVHSTPKYVASPNAPYLFAGYTAFKASNATRAARVYVGANDGMLHAYDPDGNETFAYVPSMVISNLSKLAALSYVHTYFVDGELGVGDAYGAFDQCATSPCWRSVLVGGLGAGGKGFYALDVTNPVTGTDEAAAKTNILWEIGAPSSASDNDLGYTYSRPTIARLKTGQWVAIAGNGYDSTNGKAVLYIIDLASGNVTKVPVDASNGTGTDKNGLSSPSVIDVDADFNADYVYAGDLNGNMWRFDLTAVTNSAVTSAEVTFYKLYPGTASQPITAAPDIASHPSSGFMVYFGTGRAFNNTDITDTTVQAIYGIRDEGAAITTPSLVTQTLTAKTYGGSLAVRVASTTGVAYGTYNGWKTSLPAGERLLGHIQVRGGRAQFTATNTTTTVYENWLTQLDYLSGGAPPSTVFDLNNDLALTSTDNVDGDGNAVLTDRADVVVAQKLGNGLTPLQLASQPVIAFLSGGKDTIVVSTQGLPNAVVAQPCTTNCTGGFKGGHIDVDTDSPSGGLTAASSGGLGGSTDSHVHEYDKKHCAVYVDYFSLEPNSTNHTTAGPSCGNNNAGTVTHNRLTEVYARGTTTAPFDVNQRFLILMANADLSSGGKITIGSAAPVGVKDYQDALISKIKGGTLTNADTHTLAELLTVTLDGNKPTLRNETIPGALRVSFTDSSIISGGLIPTNTGCVRDGSGAKFFNDRWRNGALITQLMKISSTGGVADTAALADVVNNVHIQADDPTTTTIENTGVVLNYTISGGVKGTAASDSSFLYESTLFWHWKVDQDPYAEALEAIGITVARATSTPCYGETGWQAARDAFALNATKTLTATELQALDTHIAKLKASGRKSDLTEAKRLESLKGQLSGPGVSTGGVLPAATSGGPQSSLSKGTDLPTGARSWYDIGNY